MNHLKPLAALALGAAVLASAGSVSANSNMPDANCAGLVFSMPQGEEGTIVRTFLDGTLVRSDTIARQGDPLTFTIASPDQTVGHVWAVSVDSVWNTDQSWTETVPACAAPTTPPPATTVPAAPSTTAPIVATTTPPVPSAASTVVTTPRTPTAPTTTPTAVTVPGTLPATGVATDLLLFITAFVVGVGVAARTIARRPR